MLGSTVVLGLLLFSRANLAFGCQDAAPFSEFRRPGDYIIAGAFPIHRGKTVSKSKPEIDICQSVSTFDDHGFHLFQAMTFAIEEVNNSSDLLPNVTLGYEIFDTCSESASVFATLKILTQCAQPYVTIGHSFLGYRPKALALIGPDRSTFSSTTASILSNFLMPQLLEKIKKVNFTLHNQSISFDDNGEPLTGYDIVMWNWNEQNVSVRVIGSYSQRPSKLHINEEGLKWHTKDNTIPVSICSKECNAGERKILTGVHLCCYSCKACPKMTFLNASNPFSCEPCERDQWSPPSSVTCLHRTVEYLSWSNPLSLVLLPAITIQLLVTLAIAVVFMHNLDTPVVKSAGGIRCLIMLASLACACGSLYLYFGEPTQETCLLRQPLFAVSFTICFSCIVVRSFQIVCIFKLASKAPKLHDFWVKKNGPNIFIGVSSTVQLLISILWVSLKPPERVADYMKFENQILLECSESSSVGSVLGILYIGLLSMFCFIFCYIGKDLPANYNEAKCITFSLLVYFVSWIAYFAIYIAYKGKYITAVNILAILSSLLGILSGYFLPKCYVILFRRELNTTEHFQSSIQNYTKKRSSN
ncbi:taste receptor type 1 member 1 [Ambystoma mexicanum]|uniref:taste receptor type 1 member 1 n=1 Tax=Ambystoma mexicanum TaxID=8296 RepID=UPI0037E991C9